MCVFVQVCVSVCVCASVTSQCLFQPPFVHHSLDDVVSIVFFLEKKNDPDLYKRPCGHAATFNPPVAGGSASSNND